MNKLFLAVCLAAIIAAPAAFSYADRENSIEVGNMQREVEKTREKLDKIKRDSEKRSKDANAAMEDNAQKADTSEQDKDK